MAQRLTDFNLNNGNLMISLTPEGRAAVEAAAEQGQNTDSTHFIHDLFEWQVCNGWEWIAPEEIGALTDAPILSDSADRDEQGRLTKIGKVYWFPNYQIESAVQTLYDTGTVTFAGVPSEQE